MKKYILELIGTMFLVLTYGFTESPLAIGAMFTVLIYLGMNISGSHYNPAISIAMWMRGKIKLNELWFYILFQTIGGFIAAALYWVIASKRYYPAPAEWVSYWKVFLIEFIFTFFVCFVFLFVMTSKKFKFANMSGLIIGFALMAVMFLGATFNPAVSIGPSLFDLFSGSFVAIKHVPEYILGSIGGGAFAGFLYQYIRFDEF
jgi:aquaporin Z